MTKLINIFFIAITSSIITVSCSSEKELTAKQKVVDTEQRVNAVVEDIRDIDITNIMKKIESKTSTFMRFDEMINHFSTHSDAQYTIVKMVSTKDPSIYSIFFAFNKDGKLEVFENITNSSLMILTKYYGKSEYLKQIEKINDLTNYLTPIESEYRENQTEKYKMASLPVDVSKFDIQNLLKLDENNQIIMEVVNNQKELITNVEKRHTQHLIEVKRKNEERITKLTLENTKAKIQFLSTGANEQLALRNSLTAFNKKESDDFWDSLYIDYSCISAKQVFYTSTKLKGISHEEINLIRNTYVNLLKIKDDQKHWIETIRKEGSTHTKKYNQLVQDYKDLKAMKELARIEAVKNAQDDFKKEFIKINKMLKEGDKVEIRNYRFKYTGTLRDISTTFVRIGPHLLYRRDMPKEYELKIYQDTYDKAIDKYCRIQSINLKEELKKKDEILLKSHKLTQSITDTKNELKYLREWYNKLTRYKPEPFDLKLETITDYEIKLGYNFLKNIKAKSEDI
ncbi:hypothetical protein LNTAR_10181 [Lentisphaera araneosa HTCC2155]|uniref:Lipoprotein n=1 Tax=Lentisphaera araneosa HTCC2155 TaxID=313628 RepID=A6DII9_9BACT|nr:hypothetical protein [Lentisphaera araneosa]EDM28275.1 hypothetical protein LNTAR_10181 [Lentisphaera araneosa HTCC2155]